MCLNEMILEIITSVNRRIVKTFKQKGFIYKVCGIAIIIVIIN